MENIPQQTLEELIHRELSKLPERQAPDTLLPRVFAQIRAREHKRWWQRPWTQWPAAIQLASLPLMLASTGAAVFAVTLLCRFFMPGSGVSTAPGGWSYFSALWDVAGALSNAVLVLGRAAGPEWLALVLFVPLAMYLACLGLGTLCYRMALNNR